MQTSKAETVLMEAAVKIAGAAINMYCVSDLRQTLRYIVTLKNKPIMKRFKPKRANRKRDT